MKKVVDELKQDMWKGVAGGIALKLPAPGDYVICQTVPPTGGLPAQSSCRKLTVTLGVPEDLGDFDSKPI